MDTYIDEAPGAEADECSIENCDRLDSLYNEYNALYDQISIAYLSGREDGKDESRAEVRRLRELLAWSVETMGARGYSGPRYNTLCEAVNTALKETEHFA